MKRNSRQLLVALAFLGAVAPTAFAAVTAEEAWVRATVPGQSTAAGYVKLRSTEPATLVGVRTPIAQHGEIHEMSVEDGIMKMRQIPRLALPAGRTVELKPGGHHLMLMNVQKPLKPGDKVPLILVIEREGKQRDELQVTAEVRSRREGSDVHGHRH